MIVKWPQQERYLVCIYIYIYDIYIFYTYVHITHMQYEYHWMPPDLRCSRSVKDCCRTCAVLCIFCKYMSLTSQPHTFGLEDDYTDLRFWIIDTSTPKTRHSLKEVPSKQSTQPTWQKGKSSTRKCQRVREIHGNTADGKNPCTT